MGIDLILSWLCMKYFVDFYILSVVRKPKSVTQVKIAQRGPILYVYF